MSNTITFTQEKFERFKKVYAKALNNNEKQFTFEGNTFLLDYGKRLIEYIESQQNK